MLATVIRQSLAVSADPVERTARIELAGRGHSPSVALTVQPAASEGWVITDTADQQLNWRVTFEAAVNEAVAQAGCMLGEQIRQEFLSATGAEAASCSRVRFDVC